MNNCVTIDDRKQQIERIKKYETMMREAELLLKEMDMTGDALARLDELMGELEAYYESDAWMQDYTDDEAGLLPEDLERGVLSQDGLYDLLEAFNELL